MLQLSMSQDVFLLRELHPNQESERVACVRRKLRGPSLVPQAKALQPIYPRDTAKNDTSSKHLLTFLRRLLSPLCHTLFGMRAVEAKGVAVGELKVNPVPCDMERDTKKSVGSVGWWKWGWMVRGRVGVWVLCSSSHQPSRAPSWMKSMAAKQ